MSCDNEIKLFSVFNFLMAYKTIIAHNFTFSVDVLIIHLFLRSIEYCEKLFDFSFTRFLIVKLNKSVYIYIYIYFFLF